jgi:signal transduction histidine kinase
MSNNIQPQIEKPPIPDKKFDRQIQILEHLLNFKAKKGIKSPHFWIIVIVMLAFGYIYYNVLETYFDLYIILFFYPMMYAALTYRLRGVIISGIAFLAIVLPHGFLMEHDAYAVVRTLLFALFAFLISSLGATLLNYLERQIESYHEIVYLNDELNKYIDQLEKTQRQLVQSEKMNALGELSASVAHEINNPLAGVLVYSKLLAKKVNSGAFNKEEMVTNLTKIENAVTYCSNIVRSLLDFARQTEPALKPINISDIIDQVMTLVGHQAANKRINVIRKEENPVPLVMADFGQIQQVFVNLVVNAIQAMPEGGKLTITVASEDGFVRTSFNDTGVGIKPEHMKKLFTPFFTTKSDVKGVGLGLSVSYGIVERHGGKIDVQSEFGKGSTFTVSLPAVPK